MTMDGFFILRDTPVETLSDVDAARLEQLTGGRAVTDFALREYPVEIAVQIIQIAFGVDAAAAHMKLVEFRRDGTGRLPDLTPESHAGTIIEL